MTRSDLIRRLVLLEISDDYENVDQRILRSVAERGGQAGLTIERFEIVDALAGLIQDGLAKAYLLSGKFSTALPGMPSLEIVEEDFATYFYITKKGVDFLNSDDSWERLAAQGISP